MESDGDDVVNIFEDYENAENDRETENVEEAIEAPGVKVPVLKRVIRNPRLKFNPERLCGERGIPVLVDHFKNVKFKGAGHEKEDLDKLLTKLEHWTHRLFPSMKFEDCLHHIEKLGRKRQVQTCLRKMRLNMPILNSDFVKDDDEDEDTVRRIENSEPIEVDAFDRLIEGSQDILNPSISAMENITDTNSIYSSPMQNPCGIGQVLGSSAGSSLTEEQRERMERNRMLAAERRKTRLAALQQNSSEALSVNEETIPSQNVSITHEKSSSFLLSEENTPSVTNDLFIKLSQDNKLSEEEGSLELSNQNSENLGLDDLMNLVDEEEPVSDKNSTTISSAEYKTVYSNTGKVDGLSDDDISEVNSSNFEQNANASISDNSDMVISDKICKIETEENLKIESLLDLVNEDSEYIQPTSDPRVSVENTLVNGNIEKENLVLNSTEVSNNMICQDY